jgi:hypothetical protein
MRGIDAIGELNEVKIAFQVKKVSYRKEASERRFTRKQQHYADVVVEVPYLVIDNPNLEDKITSRKARESPKNKLQKALAIFNKNFVKLNNGFVIFKKEYLEHIREVILKKLNTTKKCEKITYQKILIRYFRIL